MNDKKQENKPIEGIVDATEFVELKRDMQSAKVIAWLQYNQQQLIAGAVTFVLILVGYSLWKEQVHTQHESASLMYIKALNVSDQEQRLALLDAVIKDYADTGYATLATLQKVKSGNIAEKKEALESLIHNHTAPEITWQAKLDLAELLLSEGDAEGAKNILEAHFGKFYEQPRYYLLAKIAVNTDEKVDFLRKALDAESSDSNLVADMEAELAQLQASK